MPDHPPIYFLVTHGTGPNWDPARPRREQAAWTEHAAAMDALVKEGVIILGGPIDSTRALVLVAARDAEDAEARLLRDPWKPMGILRVESVARWEILRDSRPPA